MEEDVASTSHHDERVEDTPCVSAFHADIADRLRENSIFGDINGQSSYAMARRISGLMEQKHNNFI